jgi:1-acyl-sn-glycerol-3-phosphate acyltransferase
MTDRRQPADRTPTPSRPAKQVKAAAEAKPAAKARSPLRSGPAAPSRKANGTPARVNGRLNGQRTAGAEAAALAAPVPLGTLTTGAAPTPNGRSVNGAPPTGAARRAPSNAATRAAAESAAPQGVPVAGAAAGVDIWDERVAGVLRFLRRRLIGAYDVDEFGFDPELTETFIYPALRLLKEHYFRIEVSGVENLPPRGAALLVANHSGTLPMDALMLSICVHDETPLHRYLRLLGADLVFRVPLLSEIARKAGSTLACNPDAERLMRNGEYVGVFPEGFKGIGKPYRERYKLQRFGRGGFVSAALRTGTPIVPVAIVGAEEIYPIIGNLRPLARIAGLPYFPLTPLFPWLGPLGMLPLPSKWLIEFGTPIETKAFADEVDDPIVVFNLADQVRETIQHMLHSMLERRPDPFS